MIFAIFWVAFVPLYYLLYLTVWMLLLLVRATWWVVALAVGGAIVLIAKMAGALRARS